MSHELTEDELIRFGLCAGVASRELHDNSYVLRFIGRAHLVTRAVYLEVSAEIVMRLVDAGYLQADEDLFEKELKRG